MANPPDSTPASDRRSASPAQLHWLQMLEERFGSALFTLDEAKRVLGQFAPKDMLAALRRTGRIHLMDNGLMQLHPLSHARMPEQLGEQNLSEMLEDAAHRIAESRRVLDGVHASLRDVDRTGLERLREQRRHLQAERNAFDIATGTLDAQHKRHVPEAGRQDVGSN